VVQVRLKIPGAWWHPDNVQNILALRMLKANSWWDEYWKSQRKQWAQRAQRFAAKRDPPEPSETQLALKQAFSQIREFAQGELGGKLSAYGGLPVWGGAPAAGPQDT
jgi:hypothetical protein